MGCLSSKVMQILNSSLLNGLMDPDLSVSSVQFGLSSPADNSFTPESCRLLLLKSSSLSLEDWELRTDDRALQLFSERLQPFSLQKQPKGNKQGCNGTRKGNASDTAKYARSSNGKYKD